MTSHRYESTIKIPCSACDSITIKSFGWVKEHNHISCKCGASINLNTQELKIEMALIDLAIAFPEVAI